MFTGIIETIGIIKNIEHEGSNVNFTISSSITNELQVDQSVAHNGCCMTVVNIENDEYTVTAIEETLNKTNLGELKINSLVNLERCMPANGRFDGHVVQGHVDQTAKCTSIEEKGGSWEFEFAYQSSIENILVNKGSVTINGTSLTVVDPTEDHFKVCIIPYTYENTVFKDIKIGDSINLEFDIIGKYVAKMLKLQQF